MTAARSILIADDSPTQVLMHQLVLRVEGFRLLTAPDGVEAVRLAVAERPDLILMDVVMPRMTGFEAVRAIRANPATAHIPVIMVTTRAEPKLIETCFQAGCNDFVNKPVDGPLLLAKVRDLVGTASPHSTPPVQ